jgi:hypothetical protein
MAMKATNRILLTCLLTVSAAGAACADEKLQYNRDIRPILAENCFACHGPDSAARKAGLRLDKRDAAIDAGAIAPGKPNESDLVHRINASGKEHMPPVTTKKVLTAEQKEKLAKWIAAGAEYQQHWSLLAPTRPPLPAVKNEKWVRNPIDRFILAKLEASGLTPAPEADRRTLARRLSLDLTGLPPEPEEVDYFVNDKSPDWYEKYVDKLMRSPAWGEHRGRYWLDAARYADTHGIHFDNYREIWPYRDWVITAFNRNMPFDQFTIEQLAGDLLPNPTLDQQVATGFIRCNITTNEGGAIDEEYRVLYARDRTETLGQVFLGMTVGCAVCHDHKFDPITLRDFYSMSAFFNNGTQNAMDGNIKDTPPTVFVPRMGDRPKFDGLAKQRAEVAKELEARNQAARADFDQWVKNVKPESLDAPVPTEGLSFVASLSEGKGKSMTVSVNGKERPVNLSKEIEWDMGKFAAKAFKVRPGDVVALRDAGDFEAAQGVSYGAWVKLPAGGLTGAIFSRMDEANAFRGWDLWVQNNQVGAHIISKWQEDAVKAVSQKQLKPNEWHHVFVTYDGSGKAAGLKVYIDGQVQQLNVEADKLKGSTKTKVPFKLAQRNNSSRIDNVALQDVRIYSRTLTPRDVESLAKSNKAATILKKPADKRTDAEKNELYEWWLGSFDKPYQDLGKKLGELAKEESALRGRGAVSLVMQDKPGEPGAYILYRGEYDKRRDPVKPDTPKSMPAIKKAGAIPTRVELAKWLLNPNHPLTTRVTVNRFWQELFGTALVRTSGDFGVAGELPSHPELLDWMAVEFREKGWDVREFFKLLVTSATYRQASVVTPEKLEKDGANRLLSRGPRFRMDAEMIRDQALAVSGLLSSKIGGPSVKPYQPPGVWEAVAMIGSNTRDYRADKGEALYRRSLYTFWKRAAPPASMEIFNAPNRETCTVRRERTDTPLQALVTLNDPQFVEAARAFATREWHGDDNENCVLQGMGKRLLGRNFNSDEMNLLRESIAKLLAFYQAHLEDAKKLISVGESKPDPKLAPEKLAAWTMLANQLMNLDEFLNKQ